MAKIMVAVISFLLILSCGHSKKAEEKKTEDIKEKMRIEQAQKNEREEDILLLAMKYEMSTEQLTEIFIDYEKMTQLDSMTEDLREFTDYKPEEKLVDVSTALNRVSEKYGISKKMLSTIIIEKKLLWISQKGD